MPSLAIRKNVDILKEVNSIMSEIKQSKVAKHGLALPMLFLLGGFSIAYNLSIALHELGHTIMYPIAGVKMVEFVLNPFSWSWAAGERLSVTVLWGGVTLGLFLALIPLILSLRIRSNLFRFLSKILAACSLLINGIYLSMGAVFHFGDGGDLVSTGIHSPLIIGLGFLYILISFPFWADLQIYVGIDNHTVFSRRVLVVLGGIVPYMAVILFYNLIHNPRQITMWGGLASAGLLAALLISISGHLWSRFVKKVNGSEDLPRHYALHLLIVGLILILAEFVVFGTPDNPF